ncbi:hypothetical protein [Pseudalkalibacillus caeni]|uniref:Uncharacterized protein n=1 Tax=Exobacillus caeni TaxID=2574798 RepID=A0A5R9F0Z2_9BACL|nr:hypothetical protein [Pseudalkalibacillus caeni]TLS36096.1 hypothetical protein FCL54_17065 [Pseudalkalibacillus caeni]
MQWRAVDSSKMHSLFFVRFNATEAFLVLREKQQLKIPQEAFFAEEAEVLLAESELPAVEINAAITSQFIARVQKQCSVRKQPGFKGITEYSDK